MHACTSSHPGHVSLGAGWKLCRTAFAQRFLGADFQCRRVGRLPGDPTAGPLPKSLPTDWGNRTVIDLREATQEQLAELSQQSAANPLGAMLPVQPGVREDRIGRFSGAPQVSAVTQLHVTL